MVRILNNNNMFHELMLEMQEPEPETPDELDLEQIPVRGYPVRVFSGVIISRGSMIPDSMGVSQVGCCRFCILGICKSLKIVFSDLA